MHSMRRDQRRVPRSLCNPLVNCRCSFPPLGRRYKTPDRQIPPESRVTRHKLKKTQTGGLASIGHGVTSFSPSRPSVALSVRRRDERAGGDFPAHHSKGPVRPLHCAGFRNCAVAALPRLSPPLATRADATSASARCLLHPVPQGVHELMRDPDPDTGDASACAGLLSASLDAVRVLIAAPGVQTLLVMLLSDCPSHQSVGPFSAARSPHQG